MTSAKLVSNREATTVRCGRCGALYCLPIVSCTGFSIDKNGRFSESFTDFFDNPAWDEVRRRAQHHQPVCSIPKSAKR
jgi:fructose 1,6-bisphosphatase